MNEVTRILSSLKQGDSHASEALLPLVYDELRRLAAARLRDEKPGQTLQPTALVHEAFLRLADVETLQEWESRGHFFSAAAEAMRRILIENARKKGRQKHGGGWRRVDLENLDEIAAMSDGQVLALDEALEQLYEQDSVAGQLVRLRYFAGLSLDDARRALKISPATAYRHWAFARAFLRCHLTE